MEGGTDSLGLSNHNIFKRVRESLQNISIKTQNLIECKDDILFVWNDRDCCVLTLNLKVLAEESDRHAVYQTLSPTDPPSFPVECVEGNTTGTHLALIGPRGLSVLELPRRWGKNGGFQGDRENITCRCRPLEPRYLACNPHVEVRRALWHPGSPTDTHLLVLFSDNTFRLYDVTSNGVQKSWSVGRTPAPAPSPSRVPFLVGLGETAVDFTFAPVTLTRGGKQRSSGDQENGEHLQWPILVLHGNGDVYNSSVSLTRSSQQPQVHGPLSIYPPADDNYGADSCSILCLPSLPPVVVIASCSGTLYHCILLNNAEDEEENEKSWSLHGSTFSIYTPDVSLYVVEALELELGLSLDDQTDAYTCPIFLHKDISSESRYFCSHDTGVHAVSLPLISQLEYFSNSSEKDADNAKPNLNTTSIAEYLLCTKASSEMGAFNPVLGIGITEAPVVLIILLASGEVVSLPLSSILLPVPNEAPPDVADCTEFASPLKLMMKEPFDQQIRNLLKHEVTQPILKLGSGAEPPGEECLELLHQTTMLFREEYFLKNDRVREQIERRVHTLQGLKERQLQELQQLVSDKANLKLKAEQLAEKYEDLKDKQEGLTRRAEQVLRQIVQRQPIVTFEEKKLSEDLLRTEEKLKEYKKSLEQVKAKQIYNKEQVQQWQAQQKKKDIHLGQNRINTIRSNLAQMSEEIAELVQTVKTIKSEMKI